MNDLYGGTNRFFRRVVMDKHKIDVTFVEATDPEEVEKAIRPNTKMVSNVFFGPITRRNSQCPTKSL
jgi:O-acetylhomoserine/O-acetylserine sulfhydrylase-like pyridoxal-dependent enzyme